MLYSIENREDLENSNESVSLKTQVDEYDFGQISNYNFHEKIEKFYEPITDTIKDTSRDKTKTITETSVDNNKTLSNLNDKLLEVMNDRVLIASYLLTPLPKITNSENTSQFRLVKDSQPNRVKDLLMNKTIPVTL